MKCKDVLQNKIIPLDLGGLTSLSQNQRGAILIIAINSCILWVVAFGNADK